MRRRHLHHIVRRNPWPFLLAMFTFLSASAFVFSMYRIPYAGTYLIISLLGAINMLVFWLVEIIEEATNGGSSTKIVEICLEHSICLLFASEVMVFFALFWAYGHSACAPTPAIGCEYPPIGIEIVMPWHVPLLNTLVLLLSGFSITWTHRCFALKNMRNLLDSITYTIFLGIFFLFLQCIEFYSATFDLSDGIFGSVFFFLTGLHAWHVIVGVIAISICEERIFRRHFLENNYIGFVLVVWYWHLVDVIWLVLWLTIYVWAAL